MFKQNELKTCFVKKVEKIQTNVAGWRSLKKQSMDVKLSKLGFIGGTSNVELPSSQKSITNKEIEKTFIVLFGVF